MIYNLQETPVISAFEHPTQEEIKEMPNFYGSDVDFVLNHPETPDFVKNMVNAIPWSGKRKYRIIQTRTALVDEKFGMIGNFWHIDVDIPAYRFSDVHRVSQSYDDFISHFVTFGQVDGENLADTEFITTPLEIDEILDFKNLDYFKFVRDVEARRPFETKIVKSGQLVRYTSYNIHRGLQPNRKGYRGLVGSIESDVMFPINELKPKLCAKSPLIDFNDLRPRRHSKNRI
jgi:hypothetical protein